MLAINSQVTIYVLAVTGARGPPAKHRTAALKHQSPITSLKHIARGPQHLTETSEPACKTDKIYEILHKEFFSEFLCR